jgi:hypothetical protein
MRRERRGEPADLAPAHRIGLAGDRERRRAGLADPPGGEVELMIALT